MPINHPMNDVRKGGRKDIIYRFVLKTIWFRVRISVFEELGVGIKI